MLIQNSPFVTLLPPMVIAPNWRLTTCSSSFFSEVKSQFGELGSMDVALWNY